MNEAKPNVGNNFNQTKLKSKNQEIAKPKRRKDMRERNGKTMVMSFFKHKRRISSRNKTIRRAQDTLQ